MNNPRDRKNWEPIQWVKPAKHIPGKKWKLDFLKPVRPPASALVQGQKRFVAPSLQMCGNRMFVLASNPQRVPRIIYVFRRHTRLQMALESPMRVLSNLIQPSYCPLSPNLQEPNCKIPRTEETPNRLPSVLLDYRLIASFAKHTLVFRNQNASR
jgi:hypothetical protein